MAARERKRASCLQHRTVLGKMGAKHSGEVERHEALVVDDNTRHKLSFLANFALEAEALRTLGGVKKQLFQMPQIDRRRIIRRVSFSCASHAAAVAVEKIPLYAVAASPVKPPKLRAAEVAATSLCFAQHSLAASLAQKVHGADARIVSKCCSRKSARLERWLSGWSSAHRRGSESSVFLRDPRGPLVFLKKYLNR